MICQDWRSIEWNFQLTPGVISPSRSKKELSIDLQRCCSSTELFPLGSERIAMLTIHCFKLSRRVSTEPLISGSRSETSGFGDPSEPLGPLGFCSEIPRKGGNPRTTQLPAWSGVTCSDLILTSLPERKRFVV